MSNNPLKQYFRSVKFYTKVPSGTTYYTKDVVEFNDDGELGVSPMTAKDEVKLKNPDALLNGSAIAEVIKSCVPAVKQPNKLLSNDTEALMSAIRHATYGDEIDIKVACPSCKKDNKFGIGIGHSLSTMTFLEDEYKIGTADGIEIYVRPSTYDEIIKGYKSQFEQQQLAKAVKDKTLSEEEKIKIYSRAFTTMSDVNASLVTDCVIKIVVTESGLAVTDREHIREFLEGSSNSVFKSINNMLTEINAVGVKKQFTAVCEHCKHHWEADIDLNPVNFFTES